jgi:Tfp pilus assembly protein PilP
MKRLLLLTALGLGLVFAACGESDEEKARNQICDARDDIRTQVSELQDLTLTTATTDKVKSHLNAIRDDFREIVDAQGDLGDTEKQQVQKANETFRSQLEKMIGNLGTSLSLEDAAAQLKVNITDLAEAYEQALSPIEC